MFIYFSIFHAQTDIHFKLGHSGPKASVMGPDYLQKETLTFRQGRNLVKHLHSQRGRTTFNHSIEKQIAMNKSRMEVGRRLTAIKRVWIWNIPPWGAIVEHFKLALSLLILKCSLIHLGEGFYDFLASGAKGWIWHRARPLQFCVSSWQHTNQLAYVCSNCFAMETAVLMLKQVLT